MNNNEFEDLEKMFNKDIPLPESLSKENMVNMLKEKQTEQKRKIKIFPQILSVAAAAIIVIVGTVGVRTLNNKIDAEMEADASTIPAVSIADAPTEQQITTNTAANAPSDSGLVSAITQSPANQAEPGGLSKFASDAELKQYLEKLHKEDIKRGRNEAYTNAAPIDPGTTVAAVYNDTASKEFADTASVANGSLTYSKTNIQVDGVDEADIVKNDGKYLYIVSDSKKLTIVDAQTMKIAFTKEFSSTNSKKSICMEDMHLIGSRLVLVGYEYDSTSDYAIKYNDEYSTCCFAYAPVTNAISILLDISDMSNIKEIKRVNQSGRVISTRAIGNVLYTITRYTADVYDEKTLEENSVPEVDGEKLSYNEIYHDTSKDDMNQYVIVSAWDISDEAKSISRLSVLGNGDEVYCTTNKLYLTSYEFEELKNNRILESTEIYALSLNGTSITYTANGVVNGLIDNQYSVDEYNGFLRIATTGYNYNTSSSTSNLYILDGNLNVIGKLEDISKNEPIKSTRFVGDTVYVVTFRNTDPLFTIDLSNPASPKILGEVKLPGFSEYLHPVGENLLVGVGYSGNEENADMSTVKISLFDISDKSNPKELDSHVIQNAYTDVNYDAKAFLFYPEEKLIGIPISYSIYDNDGVLQESNNQFKFLQIANGKFTEQKNFTHPANTYYGSSFFRGSYIGDKLYTITNESVIEHNITSGEKLRTVAIDK